MSGHARFSPSAAFRHLNCTPSLVLEEQFQEERSPYAAEGTAGHKLAEHLIKKFLKKRTRRPVSDYYSDELLEAVDEYVAFVLGEIAEARKTCRTPFIAVEQQVDASSYVPGCTGTADALIITDKLLHVIDLKLGKGVKVYPEQNPQLEIYGLGALEMADLLYDVNIVRLTIFQPRMGNFSSWELPAESLRRWGQEVLKPLGTQALNGGGAYKAGEWCRFCKARNQCRARADAMLELAKYEFKQPDLLADTEIADILVKADDLAKWAADIYAYAQDQAAIHGKVWPGFKLVHGRTNRKYTDEDDVVSAAEKAGFSDIWKKSLITITEMERLMGKKKFAEVLGNLVYKPEGKLTLVPAADKRPEVNKTTAKAEFTEDINHDEQE
jgi:hypothetical protein